MIAVTIASAITAFVAPGAPSQMAAPQMVAPATLRADLSMMAAKKEEEGPAISLYKIFGGALAPTGRNL